VSDAGDDRAGGRIQHIDKFAATGGNFTAVNDQAARADAGSCLG